MSELLLVLSAVLTATAQYCIRRGARSLSRGKGLGKFLISFFRPFLLTGLFLTLTVPLLYIRALSDCPLSRAFAFNSLTHLFVFLTGRFLLKEKTGRLQWAGLALILTGFLLPLISGAGR